MFCEKCGNEVHDEAVICVSCGVPIGSSTVSNNNVNMEPLEGGVKFVSFCFPIVGAILFFVHQSSAPQKSTDACHMALWGVGFSIAINIFVAIGGGF